MESDLEIASGILIFRLNITVTFSIMKNFISVVSFGHIAAAVVDYAYIIIIYSLLFIAQAEIAFTHKTVAYFPAYA